MTNEIIKLKAVLAAPHGRTSYVEIKNKPQ